MEASFHANGAVCNQPLYDIHRLYIRLLVIVKDGIFQKKGITRHR